MPKRTVSLFGMLAVVALHSTTSLGCFAPPAEAGAPPMDLVLGASFVVLAEAKSNLSGDGDLPAEFLFETKEVPRGDAPKSFKYYGFSRGDNLRKLDDFDGHTDPRFWAYSYGNSTITTWYGVFGVYEIGQTYLIIASEKGHFKAYENVRSENDLWLKVVRHLVSEWSSGTD